MTTLEYVIYRTVADRYHARNYRLFSRSEYPTLSLRPYSPKFDERKRGIKRRPFVSVGYSG